ncbi:hypothetical protein RN001_012518 [Aquatica leii]|uniref:Cathepsin L n=1 Tax=Aquatica leii TaxID=1421715 RepID=A0AAN7P7D7_9COLE|nr:hypothetical protein RN001_012518 [Aquatica leii]
MKLIVLVVAFTASQVTSSNDLIEEKWITFKNNFRKQYSNRVEETNRLKIFNENLKTIDAHNKKYEKGLVSYTLGINQFSDLLHSEFIEQTSCLKQNFRFLQHFNQTFIVPENIKLDSRVDWRSKGAVTPVKDQGECGSCWAFSTTGAIEGQNFLQNGKLISLSEQNLVDCSTANSGCDGGSPILAYQYVIKNKGIDTEESYPYQAQKGTCQFNPNNVGAQVYEYKLVAEDSEDDLKYAVATVGPVSVLIDSTDMQHYQNGVYNNSNCKKMNVDHAVLVVGYGTTKKVSLSEQNLMDCSSLYGGCHGGTQEEPYDYVIKNHGIDTEKSYPYQYQVETCQFNPNNVGAHVYGYKSVTENSENDLKSAVALVGPIATSIDAQYIDDYQSGIYNNPECTKSLNHGVLIVGYGTSKKGVDY